MSNIQPSMVVPPPRKRRVWPWWVLAGAVALVLVTCLGIGAAISQGTGKKAEVSQEGPRATKEPATTDTDNNEPAAAPQPTDKSLAVGETFTITGDGTKTDYTVTKTEQKAVDRFGLKPEHGVFLLVHLKVKMREGETFVCSCELGYVSSTGKVFDETISSFKSRPMFESAQLHAGQNTDGWIIFDVPKPVKGGRIQLTIENFWTDNDYGYWQL